MRRFVASALAALLPALTLAGPAAAQSPWAASVQLVQQGRPQDAVRQLALYAPRDPEPAFWLAEARHHLGDDAGAIAQWNEVEGHQARTASSSWGDRARARLRDLQAEGRQLGDLLATYRQLRLDDAAAVQWDRLSSALAALSARDPDGQTARRAALVQADCLAHAGHPEAAATVYRAELTRYPALGDLCLARLARLAGSGSSEAVRLDQQLAATYPGSPLAPTALLDAAKAIAQDDPTRASKLLRQVQANWPSDPAAERALYLLAVVVPGDRLAELREYRRRYPDGPHGMEVAQHLAQHPGLSAAERLALGHELYLDHDYGGAIRTLRGVAQSGLDLYHLGRAQWADNDLRTAERTLQQALAKDASLRARILITLGQIAEDRNRAGDAEEDYRAAARYGGERGLDALELLSHLYRKHDQDEAARRVDQQLIDRYPGADAAAEALWRFMWKAYRAGDHAGAHGYGERLARNPGPEGTRGLYWLGRLDSRNGNASLALRRWREVAARDPLSFYGWRARFRLAAAEGGQDPGFAVATGNVPPPRTALAGWGNLLPPVEARLLGAGAPAPYVADMQRWPERMRELVYLAQFDAVERYCDATRAPGRIRGWIALQQGRYERAIHLADGDPLLTYPLGYWSQLNAAAGAEGLDPLLLAGLVRQESLFDPHSISWVGAVGLAQLMPDTARGVARALNIPPRPLTDPGYNLALGAHYLATSARTFANRAYLAVAAYNAGDGAVGRWVHKYAGDPEEFVECIPYPETRDYVKKVFGNYWSYRSLYAR